jgi:hypothetical protein
MVLSALGDLLPVAPFVHDGRRVPEVNVDDLFAAGRMPSAGAILTGRYLLARPTVLLSDGAMDGV